MINNHSALLMRYERDNMIAQPKNWLSGVETRSSIMRITAQCGFFMRYVRAHPMVGRAGQPKGWPGFMIDRFSTPVRFTTSIVENVVVNSTSSEGVQS